MEETNPQTPAKKEPPKELARYISSEVTLELFGYYDAGYKRRYPGKDGAPTSKRVQTEAGTAKTIPTAEYGFPNTFDQDLRRGFEAIIAKRLELREAVTETGVVRRPHLTKVPVVFTIYELLKESGVGDSKQNYRAAIEWVKRTTGTMIEAPILDVSTGKLLMMQTHLFRETVTPGDTLPSGDTADKVAIVPADWYLRHLAHRKTLLTDHTFYKALSGFTIAKTLLSSLAVGFRAAGADPYRKSYRKICDAFHLTFYRYPSKREEKFNPDLAELHRLGYLEGGTQLCRLEDCPKKGSPHGRGWRWDHEKEDSVLYFYAGPKFRADQQHRLDRLELAKSIDALESPRTNETTPARAEVPTTSQPFSSTASADQREAREAMVGFIVDDILRVTDDPLWRPAYLKLARWAYGDDNKTSLVRMAVTDTRDHAASGRGFTTTKGAYFFGSLREYAKQRNLPLPFRTGEDSELPASLEFGSDPTPGKASGG